MQPSGHVPPGFPPGAQRIKKRIIFWDPGSFSPQPPAATPAEPRHGRGGGGERGGSRSGAAARGPPARCGAASCTGARDHAPQPPLSEPCPGSPCLPRLKFRCLHPPLPQPGCSGSDVLKTGVRSPKESSGITAAAAGGGVREGSGVVLSSSPPPRTGRVASFSRAPLRAGAALRSCERRSPVLGAGGLINPLPDFFNLVLSEERGRLGWLCLPRDVAPGSVAVGNCPPWKKK